MPGTYTNLLYHLVFSTKNRIPLITAGLREDLFSYMGGIIRGERGKLLEIGGMTDHVHLLAKLRATVTVAEMLNRIKAKSSKWINEEKSKLRKFGWQEGYGILCERVPGRARARIYSKPRNASSKIVVSG